MGVMVLKGIKRGDGFSKGKRRKVSRRLYIR